MSDEANNPLVPADPPETQPPTGSEPQTASDADSTELKPADPPETQGGGT